MTRRGFATTLSLRLVAALLAPVGMAAITAAADPERPLALPAVPSIQNRHILR